VYTINHLIITIFLLGKQEKRRSKKRKKKRKEVKREKKI
jgi:hypothetical protein